MLKKFGGIRAKRGIGGVVVEVRRRSLNSSLLDLPVSLQVFVSAEKMILWCVFMEKKPCVSRHLKSCWAVHLNITFHLGRRLPPRFVSPAFIPRVVLPFARGEPGVISYTWRGARCGTAGMQASARGFCAQKIQLKNNYQKISGSPVRLYCFNRCFLFICCNNRMLF